jgi:hypothetical protein
VTWVLIGLVVAGVFLCLGWWAKYSPRSTVGQSDFSSTIHETMCWAKDGGRLILKDPATERGVAFTKRAPQNGGVRIHVGLLGPPPSEEKCEKFRGRLEVLGIPTAPGCEAGASGSGFEFTVEEVPEPEICGRIADLALEAVGLARGDPFIHTFEGTLDMDAVKEYRQRRFGARLNPS